MQAYVTYAGNGYQNHVAWAAAWLCKYQSSSCSTATAQFDKAFQYNLQYSLGYDW